jgi:O-antigen ligase
MVIILGLGLGLVVGMNRQSFTPKPWLQAGIIAATLMSFVGIFCSGSRNALAVAILQVLLAASLLRLNRWLRLAGLLSLVGLGVVVASFGLGGRRISLEVFGRDPRFGLWQIAVGLIQERPWLGWGLGSFKFLYPSRLIDPDYPYIAHPHNFGLMMATEAGLPTMLVFFAVIGAICYWGVSAYRASHWHLPEKTVLLACLLACLGSFTYALFDTTLFDMRINLLNWTVLAVMTGVGLPHHSQQRE